MKLRRALGGVLVVGLAVVAAACGNSLPHDHGEVWECEGTAVDQVCDATGENCMQEVIALIGPGAVPVTECANPGVSQNDLTDACKSDCESKFREWGFFSQFPFIYHDISGCTITTAVGTGRPCKDPVSPFNGGPANASIGLDQGTSTVDVDVKGHTGSGHAFGTLDVTIDPFCAASSCSLFISRFDLGVTSFDLDGHTVHDVDVQNAGTVSGTWSSDTSFELPPNSLSVSVVFGIDNDSGSTTLVNSANSLHGNLSPDYSSFTLSGDFDDGNGSTVHLDLSGSAIAHPPVAHFVPTGPIQCDAPPAVAHVTLDSSASSDPDGDLVHRLWNVDGQLEGLDQATLPKVLSLGPHSIGLDVTDSRGGVSDTSGQITVIDTTPPSLTASLTPTCLWPPNHDYVLYTFGDGIDASATDICDANPTIHVIDVESNQPPLGGGSGNSSPDIAFGTGAFCVRAERDGTQSTDRVYTITLEAADFVGNKKQKQLTVRVPHDLGQGGRADCPNVDPSRIVEDGDPRCTQAAVDPQPPKVAPPVKPNGLAPLPPPAAASSGSCAVGEVGQGSSSPWGAIAIPFVIAGCVLLRRRRLAPLSVLLCLFASGCGKGGTPSQPIASAPLSGTVAGQTVTVSGMRGQWSPDHSRLTILLSSYSAQCATPAPAPTAGQTLTEIDISIPQGQLQPGTYSVSSDVSGEGNDVGVGITQYSLGATGKIQQSTTYVQSGTLRLDSVGASSISGGLGVAQGGTSLSGTFSATLCP
jgi:hypothetical protein